MDISAFKPQMEKENIPAEVEKIKAKIKIMESGDYFLNLIRKVGKYEREFKKQKTPTPESEYLKELARLEFLIEEVRYNKYKDMLETPERINILKLELKKELKELEEQKRALVKVGEQLKLNSIVELY